MSQRSTFRLQPGVVDLADEAIRRVETGSGLAPALHGQACWRALDGFGAAA